MEEIHETDDGKIVHLTWDEYKAIRTLHEGWDQPHRSTRCPTCDEYAISGAQAAGEHDTETCECPNGHTWTRSLKDE